MTLNDGVWLVAKTVAMGLATLVVVCGVAALAATILSGQVTTSAAHKTGRLRGNACRPWEVNPMSRTTVTHTANRLQPPRTIEGTARDRIVIARRAVIAAAVNVAIGEWHVQPLDQPIRARLRDVIEAFVLAVPPDINGRELEDAVVALREQASKGRT